MIINMVVAGLFGLAIPVVLWRLRIDPGHRGGRRAHHGHRRGRLPRLPRPRGDAAGVGRRGATGALSLPQPAGRVRRLVPGVELEELLSSVVGRRAHDVAPGTELADPAAEAHAGFRHARDQGAQVVAADADVVDRAPRPVSRAAAGRRGAARPSPMRMKTLREPASTPVVDHLAPPACRATTRWWRRCRGRRGGRDEGSRPWRSRSPARSRRPTSGTTSSAKSRMLSLTWAWGIPSQSMPRMKVVTPTSGGCSPRPAPRPLAASRRESGRASAPRSRARGRRRPPAWPCPGPTRGRSCTSPPGRGAPAARPAPSAGDEDLAHQRQLVGEGLARLVEGAAVDVELALGRFHALVGVDEPGVAETGRALDRGVGVGAEPDRRMGCCIGLSETVAPSRVKCEPAMLTPSSVQRRTMASRFSSRRITLSPCVVPKPLNSTRAVAEAGAEDHASARHHVEGGDLLGDVERLVQREQDDPTAAGGSAAPRP